jgi:hypothetical protein
LKVYFLIRYVTADRRGARDRADADERKQERAACRSSAIDPTDTWRCFALTLSWLKARRRMLRPASNFTMHCRHGLYQNGAARLAPALLFIGRLWSSDGGNGC